MFAQGDYVVKSLRGVCKVNDIVDMEAVPGKKVVYYELYPLKDDNSKIYVPVETAGEKMREVMSEQQARELIDKIPSINECWINNEREREKNYKEAIASNNPEKLIAIIKLIYHRKKDRLEQGKKTTAVDGRYFDAAEDLLYTELGIVFNKNKNEIFQMIKECCDI